MNDAGQLRFAPAASGVVRTAGRPDRSGAVQKPWGVFFKLLLGNTDDVHGFCKMKMNRKEPLR